MQAMRLPGASCAESRRCASARAICAVITRLRNEHDKHETAGERNFVFMSSGSLCPMIISGTSEQESLPWCLAKTSCVRGKPRTRVQASEFSRLAYIGKRRGDEENKWIILAANVIMFYTKKQFLSSTQMSCRI